MVREAGLEPARPEWTLEPELDLDRYGMCRIVSPSTPQTVENTSFLNFSPANPAPAPDAKNQQFVGCLLDVFTAGILEKSSNKH